jgi:dTDP-4-amino-4,6-dideoxygalactose transaminase
MSILNLVWNSFATLIMGGGHEMKVPILDLARQQATFGDGLIKLVSGVIATGQYLNTQWPTFFEAQFADYCGRPFAVGVGSGTAALQIALLSAGVGPGDEVITVPNSFFASTEAILLCGATPRFVDVDERTQLMSLSLAEQELTPQTKAILPVHLFGNVVDVMAIESMLVRRGRQDVVVIEDCAHAAGSSLLGRKVPLGSTGAFSFNPGKNIGALGDAGAIVTSSEPLAHTARALRDHGRASKTDHHMLGFNSRLRAIDDRVLSMKLGKLDEWNESRRRHASCYDKAFASTTIQPVATTLGSLHARHQYVVCVAQRDRVRAALADRGVATAVHYPTLIVNQRPLSRFGWTSSQFPVATALNNRILSLPCFPELSPPEISWVINAICSAAEGN